MDKIALLPAIFSFIITFLVSPRKAFVWVFIPALILIPYNVSVVFPGIPDFRFSESALLPIFFSLLTYKTYRGWTISLMDFLVVGIIFSAVFAEYNADHFVTIQRDQPDFLILEMQKKTQIHNYTNFDLAKTTFANMVKFALLPYFVGKALLRDKEISVAVAKMLVGMTVVSVFLSYFEFFASVNPIRVATNFFFRDFMIKEPTTRFDLVRVEGAWGHPIIYCVMIVVALIFCYWLYRGKYASKYFFQIPFPINKKILTYVILLSGMIMTFSRGPMVGGIFASCVIGLGFSRNISRSIAIRAGFLVALVFVVIAALAQYVGVQKQLGADQDFTVAYRLQLFSEYFDTILQKPYFGWGKQLWPKSLDMVSVDNHYLWMALDYGLVTVGIFLTIVLSCLIRTFIRGVQAPRSHEFERSLAFTFSAVYLALMVALLTVYMGFQLNPLFYLFTGWVEGFLHNREGFV